MYSMKHREWGPPPLNPEQVCFPICPLLELFVLLWLTNKT